MLTLAGCIPSPKPASVSGSANPAQASPAPTTAARTASSASAAGHSPQVSDGSSGARTLQLDISAAGIAVDGKAIGLEEAALKRSLPQAGAIGIDIHAKPDAPPALVLAALTVDAGPRVTRRLLNWQDVELEVSENHSFTGRPGERFPTSIFSWRSVRAAQLWSVSPGPTIANLGPFEPGDPKAEPAAISNLAKACAPSGCRIAVEIREDGLLDDLRAWQRIVATVVPSLGFHVFRALRAAPPAPQPKNVGTLPPGVIQSVIRVAFDRIRACYEDGLGRDPKLTGRVSVRFVIERDGIVKNTTDDGSDIPDKAVRDCVIRTFGDFKFPPPEAGIVTVVYPIMLAPE